MLRAGSDKAEPSGSTFYPFFMNSVVAGLVPPFSDFFYAVLGHYKLHAFHLDPNSVLLLSIFAFYYEAFVGVRPSVALFRHFFSLRTHGSNKCSSCISFIVPLGNTLLKAGKKVDNF